MTSDTIDADVQARIIELWDKGCPLDILCDEVDIEPETLANSFGTTWIDHVQAADPYEAAEKGKEQCAEDWGWDDSDGISVLGVLRGEPTVEFWND